MLAMWRLGRVGFIVLLGLSSLMAAPMADAEPVPVQQPLWGGCEQWVGDTSLIPTAQCAQISVPLDYANPAGTQAQIAVIRVLASGQRIGALMVNPGGPGSSAVDTVAGMARSLGGTEFISQFDLVGFDPRGVGHSTPELRCRTDAEFDAYRREPRADYSPAGVAQIEALYQQFAAQCAERMGVDVLANIGTANAAQDMDGVRAALGDEQINYLGFSYGTALGTQYLQRYPDRVRAMVLDGAIDPAQSPIDENIRQMAGFQGAFEDYARDCALSEGCPLGTDPTQWVARYHALINPLVTAPAYTSDPRGLSYADAFTGTVNALYTPSYWKYLTSGLLGLALGTDAGDLLMLADEYQTRDYTGHYSNKQDAFNAIRCVDSPAPTDAASWVDADARIRQVAPFAEYGSFTGFAPRDICAFWPVPATSAPHLPAPVPFGKVVVVSTSRDPATPYQAGVNLAGYLGAPLITYNGTQHTVVFTGQQCVDTAVTQYLANLVTPPDNLTC